MSKRNVSPDSSTQPQEEHKKLKKRKQKHHSHGHGHKNKKKKKEEKLTDELHVPSDSSSIKYSKKKTSKRKSKHQSPTAVSPQIKPLGEYVDDKEELYKELLKIISKKEMKEMLPDIVKKEDLKEVKRLCLEQLKATPIDKLKDIISGKETSSSVDEDLEAMVVETAQAAEEQDLSAASVVEEEKDAEIFEELITAPNQEDIDELVEGRHPVHKVQEQGVEDNDSAQATGPCDEKPINEELELRELEFRARALKSLVQARERQMKVTTTSPDVGTS